MTLTTEQLRARAEALGLDFFIERRAGIWVKEWLNDGCTSATAEEVMMWSMLANREAQPVGFYTTVSGRKGVIWHNGAPEDDTAIYTAPPAPANAAAWEMRYWSDGYNIWGDWERISEALYTRLSAEHATDNDYEFRVLYDAPPAPKLNAADWGINMQTGTQILVYKNCSVIESEQAHFVLSLINSAATPAPAVPECFINAVAALESLYRNGQKQNWNERYTADMAYASGVINACRAAMLAQPVSSGYKLVPVDCLTTASRLIDLCRTYIILHDTSDYRVRTINECENTIEVIDGLLAAAPGGGNDHDAGR
ncbi:hypothetical protein ACX8XK_23640 [Serratia marcescens]|uniref:hypothetical protein n=1 Tax=Serratia sarumanii TaxID=3020826 RepID=UPI003F8072B4